MSFRGRGGPGRGAGGFRGGGRGAGGSYRGRGGGGGFNRGGRGYDQGPPETVTTLGHFAWSVQDDLVLKVDIDQVPFFNAPIYTEQKQQVGKIDEIFGNIRDHYVSVKLSENIKASSFEKDTQLYIDVTKLLPLQRFLPKPPGEKRGGAGRGMRRGGRGRGGGGGGGGGRGSFGGRASFGRGGGFNNRGGSGGFRGRGGNGSFNRNNSGGRGGGRGRW